MNEPGSAMRRKLLSRSAAIFAIRFFPLAAAAAAGIVCSRRLSPHLNGVYLQVWVYMAVFVAIAAAGLPPLMLTHTALSVDGWLRRLRIKHVLTFTLWVLLLAVMLVGIFLYLGVAVAWVGGALFGVQVVILLLETYFIIHGRFGTALAGSLLYAIGFCTLHYFFLNGFYAMNVMFWLIALLGCLRVAVLAVSAALSYKRHRSAIISSEITTGIRRQWLQLGIYDVSQVAFRWIDKVIISLIVPSALYAIYQNGTQDVPFMATLLSAVGNGLLQQMASGEKTTQARVALLNVSGALLGRVVFPVFFFLFFFRQELIVTVLTEKYLPSVPLFAVSVLALPLRAYNYTSILQHLNRVKVINWGALLDLGIALGLSYPLYLWRGLTGVAFAFMISSYIQAWFYLFHTSRSLACSVAQLVPWKSWSVMLIVFGFAAIGMHEGLSRSCGERQTLLLGFAGTVGIIAAALLPVVFTKKSHG